MSPHRRLICLTTLLWFLAALPAASGAPFWIAYEGR